MTAGEAIAAADSLRPNQYTAAQKLAWLRRLDGQIARELADTHEGEAPELPESYESGSVLLAPCPYDEELYTAYLFAQIDLNNAEIVKYNQSVALLGAAWRQLADAWNRTRRPRSRGAFRL